MNGAEQPASAGLLTGSRWLKATGGAQAVIMLSIVIVTYNTREPLRRCLQSITALRGDLDLDVIVVDNGSKDGTAAMVRDTMPDAVLIEPGENTWFTGGNNLGVARASGDPILILNPDTLIQPDTLPVMLDYLHEHPNVGAITCRMEYPEGGVQRTCSRVPRYADLLLGYTFLGVILAPLRDRLRRRMWYDGWDRDTTQPVEVIPGSCIMARRDLLHRLGTFDTAFKLYFPEDDLCRRMLATGAEIHFVAGALLLHEEHASVKQAQRLASRIYFDDLITYARKHYGALAALILRLLVIPTRAGMDWMQRLRGERDSF